MNDQEYQNLLNDPAIETEDLDDLVHDAADIMAARVNNGGKEDQLDFLRDRGWTEEDIRKSLNPPPLKIC